MQSSQATERHPAARTLVEALERIGEVDREVAALEARVDELKKLRAGLEAWAVQEIETQRAQGIRGREGVRAGGRTYWTAESLHISVPKDRRDAVLEAARAVGIQDEITTVSTPTLKAWLVEQAKEAGREAGTSFVAGTPFDGIVSEYTEVRLRHTTVAGAG